MRFYAIAGTLIAALFTVQTPAISAQEPVFTRTVADPSSVVQWHELTVRRSSSRNPGAAEFEAVYFNAGEQRTEAVEFLFVGFSPWNELLLASRGVDIERVDVGDSRMARHYFDFAGRRQLMSVVGIVTRIRFADNSVWQIENQQLRSLLENAVADFDWSAVPEPVLDSRLQDVSGVYAFDDLQLPAGNWERQTPRGGCVPYLSTGEPSYLRIFGSGAVAELVSVPSGRKIMVCGNVLHLPLSLDPTEDESRIGAGPPG